MAYKKGDIINFSPELDRGANFLIQKIESVANPENVEVHFTYIDGRWAPDNKAEIFKFEVPKDFTVQDIECAWFNIPNFERLKNRS